MGRLEVRLDGVWGSVNGLNTGNDVARVACRSMDYKDGSIVGNCLTEFRDFCGDKQ